MVDQNKRQLFKHVMKHAQKAHQVPRTIPRPPTSLPESEFIEACSGCSDCVSACPKNIIFIHKGLAAIDFDLSSCSYCLQCQTVCPTTALSHSVSDCGVRPTVNSNCNPQTAVYCAECSISCQNNAIQIIKNQTPIIEHSLCNGCAECRSQCPNSAIDMVFT